ALGLQALFTLESASRELLSRFHGVDRVVSWFGARDETYVRRLRSIVPDAIIAPPVPPEGSGVTVWQYLLATIRSSTPPDLSPIDPSRSGREDAARALTRLGVDAARPRLVVQSAAGSCWKIWPVERMARVVLRVVAQRSDTLVLVHQGPADRDAAGRLGRLL